MELVFLCVTAVVCIVLVALVAIKDKAARALRNELEEARIENARLKEKIGLSLIHISEPTRRS